MSVAWARRHPVLTVSTGVVLLAIMSLLSNIVSVEQLSRQDEIGNYFRLVLSKLLNAGTVWAALGFYSGWVFADWGRPRHLIGALVAGLASLAALTIHYALGNVLGIMDSGIWLENAQWFVAAVIIATPLGLLGSRSAQADTWGSALRFLVPMGALAEPVVTSMFWYPAGYDFPPSQVYSSYTVGAALIISGGLGVLWQVRSLWRKEQRGLAAK